MQCLHPEVREQNTAMKYVRELAQEMPSITAYEVVMVTDECKLYRNEAIESSVVYTNKDELKRVDHFWNDVLGRYSASGNPKFRRNWCCHVYVLPMEMQTLNKVLLHLTLTFGSVLKHAYM